MTTALTECPHCNKSLTVEHLSDIIFCEDDSGKHAFDVLSCSYCLNEIKLPVPDEQSNLHQPKNTN